MAVPVDALDRQLEFLDDGVGPQRRAAEPLEQRNLRCGGVQSCPELGHQFPPVQSAGGETTGQKVVHPVQLAAQFPGLLGETGSGPGGPAGLDESVARIGQRLQEHPEVRPTPLPPAEKLRHRTGTGQGPVHLDIDVRAVLDATKDLSDDQVPEENRRVRLFPEVAAAREPGGNLPGGDETRCAGGQAVEQDGHRGGFVRDLRDVEAGAFQIDARQGCRGTVPGSVEGQRHVVPLRFPRRVGHFQQGA